MDFFQIAVKEKKGGGLEAYPDWIVGRSKDLMVRAKNFYAVWDPDKNLWSTDEYDVQRIVDDKLHSYQKENKDVVSVKTMRSFGSNGQSSFRKFMSQIGDNSHQLDSQLTFLSTKVEKGDYVSKRLPYDLAPGDISSWEQMVSTLYAPGERDKIEWFIGSIVSGDAKDNQKFLVLEGPPGAGKGTIINIVMMLFPGYITTFDAKALGSNGNQFAAAAFAGNPLVAIQHDGDLSKIEDNTTLNSIISHEIMKVNEKYKPAYDARINAALIMGTNKPVMITDSMSGMIRRLIDVHPTGNLLPPKVYHALMAQIQFELGHIAHHCLNKYKSMGKNYFSNYRPLEMMYKTNAFINYIELHRDIFEKQGGVSAKQAWQLYKDYCEEANITRPMKLMEFRAELSTYFEKFHDRIILEGTPVRSYYEGLKTEAFKMPVSDDNVKEFTLKLEETTSLFDLEFADCPAQYATASGAPKQKWDNVKTTLAEIDTSQEHFVKGLPENFIVIDFDLKDDNGKKSLGRNLEAAATWPATYAELSKSGEGVHLHYYFDGDTERLDPLYGEGIEVKVYRGNSALRRRLTRCNSVAIATISSGLPFKEKQRVLDPGTMKSEKALRDLIARNLRKEIHPGTKPSIDFIKKILDDAYEDGLRFDVSDLKQRVVIFANNSTNRAFECLKVVENMRWKSEDDAPIEEVTPADDRLVFWDLEVYPNLFVICWKFKENDGDKPSADNVMRMINPKPHEVEALLNLKLIGFNNRNYDNHIMWAAALGYNNAQLHNLSQRIINGSVGAKFGEAYRISHADVYDFSTKKQGLKKWQIELSLEHREMDIPWDEPVPENRIMDVVEYCVNDVVSLEEVFNHLQGDWKARLILSDLSGLTPNDTTAKHTAAIVFGRDKNPQSSFVYTRLSKEFPGYVFEAGKSTYRGEVVGEGGYVYAEPGIYKNVVLLDVASMHPTSIGQLNLFGEHTPRYMALVDAQLFLKNLHKTRDFDHAKTLLDGKLTSYIEDIEKLFATDPEAGRKAAGELRYGLKIAMNIVYGLTSAKFDNPFKHNENVDNIVAKRGALFMIDLKHFIQEQGYKVVHIKTDSVKIPDATPEIIEKVVNFAKKYGYDMDDEATYAKFGLVNDAVYVAKKDGCDLAAHSSFDPRTACWSATGAQYQEPYVYKKLFGYSSDINFNDVCVTKHVQQGSLHLDFGPSPTNEPGGWLEGALNEIKVMKKNKEPEEKLMAVYNDAIKKLIFVGKTGRFTPVKKGYGGGQLYRLKEGRHYAVAGTKGYLWMDSALAMDLPDDAIDYSYFENLTQEARENLDRFLVGSGFATVDEFLS